MFNLFQNLKLAQKLLACFLILGVLPAVIVGLLSSRQASEGLETLAFQQLESIREIKKAQLKSYFSDRKSDMDSILETSGTLRRLELARLEAVREVKQEAVERYLETVERQVRTFSEDRMIVEAMNNFKGRFNSFIEYNDIDEVALGEQKKALFQYYDKDFRNSYLDANGGNQPADLKQIFEQLDDEAIALQYQYIINNPNPLGSKHLMDKGDDISSYSRTHGYVHPSIRHYLEQFGYYDIFLVDHESGDIVYSVFKELDYATSLIDGPYAKTNFADVFRQAAASNEPNKVFFTDFKSYFPSYEAPAGFVASPVFDGDQKIGVAIFQFPIDRLNAIVAQRTGMGQTGETYLVGEDNLMRSDSYLDPESRSVGNSFRHPEAGKVSSSAVIAALKGESGHGVVHNYLDRSVLSAWSPLRFGNFNWAMIAEIDITEAMSPVNHAGEEYYDHYVKKTGYYDLFLINPDGYIFYTAAKESDYHTNILTGKYSSSNLAKLVAEVMQTKQFGFADFSPYAPSNDEPAAFVAQPLIVDGQVEMVVALQLPLEGINNIMGIREGMGNTGESYLVGTDKLMRSDSYLDPEGRTVKASFAGSVADNGVDTAAVREALAGKTDTRIITDYNGHSVLSAYTPVDLEGKTWALLAEIDETEAFEKVNALQWGIVWVIVPSILIIIVIGLFLARRISAPLSQASVVATQVSEGDLTADIEVTSSDEVGDLQEALKKMSEGLRSMVTRIRHSSDQQAAAAEELSAITDETLQHVRRQHQSTDQVATAINEMGMTVQEVSRSTSAAAEAATAAQTQVEEGNVQVNKAIESVHLFSKEVETMSSTLKEVATSADNIGGIVDVINGIADQTNLLALNAAIEAARAGDQGRGFAVVADEVRSLAQSTQMSTKQIADMIAQLQQGAQASTASMQRGQGQLEQVVTQAELTGEALARIQQSILSITDMSTQIASAAEEQSAVAEDINKNVTDISELSASTESSTQQITNASEELARLAAELQSEVQRFKI
ncbi:methyl-accepting chemotaxis protein [Motiliproteus sp. MSK22-1]|uniref:methyl-accepting chemotaxis protein n=1 Tax=Motiliproteus sp. MSK22-1 TaxID=1897630 RepID=UPI000978287F|nr:methyl-accepting chemotaxis protein [Motiliproteus sp. MSK22-1]OMH31804.1 hypothetical protein BGP75_16960 [Motiliproteus sp. MSK22-1]